MTKGMIVLNILELCKVSACLWMAFEFRGIKIQTKRIADIADKNIQ